MWYADECSHCYSRWSIKHALVSDHFDSFVAMQYLREVQQPSDSSTKRQQQICCILQANTVSQLTIAVNDEHFWCLSLCLICRDSRKFEDDILGAYVNLEDEETMVNEQVKLSVRYICAIYRSFLNIALTVAKIVQLQLWWANVVSSCTEWYSYM